MKYNTIVITGSNGSTARGLINYFSNISQNVIGVTRTVRQEYEQSNVSILTADMDKLTEGQIKTFESYSDYRIDVYSNSKDCLLPENVRAVSTENSKMINGNEGIEWTTLGAVPFPNPTHAQHYILSLIHI